MSLRHVQFHIQYHGPSEHWPTGSYALYEITGDQIAKRVRFDDNGEATYRESWSGYIGMFASPASLAEAIDRALKVAA